MVEYLYFVKFDDHDTSDTTTWYGYDEDVFNTFEEAKTYARSAMNRYPVITQTEIIRNDFGECVESRDFGVVWSWKEEMPDVLDNDEATIFSSGDFDKYADGYDPENDPELSDDDIVFETNCVANKSNLDYFWSTLQVGDEVFCKVNKKSGVVKAIKGETVTVEFTGGEDPDRIDTYYKTDLLPPVKSIVEAMEENEDEVECVVCEELSNKSECKYEEGHGYVCEQCSSKKLTEAFDPNEAVELYYENLTVEIITKVYPATRWDPEDYEEGEYTDDFTYTVDAGDVATLLWEDFMTEEDVADIEGGFDVLEDDTAWYKFLDTHFDVLVEKYYKELLAHYKEDAEEAAREEFQERFDNYEPDYDDYYEESVATKTETKSMLEELEEPDVYRQHLIICPECGTDSFDAETGICINCGFN